MKTIERVLHDVGSELKSLRGCPPSRLPKSLVPPPPAGPPQLAVVMFDGGRMMTRQPERGPGVHEQAWRETKNASLESMTHQRHAEDPRPELPLCFQEPEHVAELAGTAALPVPGPVQTTLDRASADDDHPQRLVRTCLSSLDNSKEFGLQMSREAKRRCLDQASQKAFIGDGLPANWTIWKKHFRDFVPILDFMHAVEYVYAAAIVIHAENPLVAWASYRQWAQLCWSGHVREVIPELLTWLDDHDLRPGQTLDEQHPHKAVHDAHRYLSNNASRMNYAVYRTQGLPVTSAPMESLVKQINLRVKGTEMFWNDGLKGGEAILQIRSAALSDDGRLKTYLTHRPGCPYVRRTTGTAYGTLNC
ncbi:MAG: hypothetical protein KF861_16170 [Planctomycetaceae bacterium]|nr:hypothetical protein [Planctomycetaceae bacterium]